MSKPKGRGTAGRAMKPSPKPKGWRKRAKVSKADLVIVDTLRKALLERRGDWMKLVKANKLNYRWLVSFARGDIDSPGIVLFRKLANAVGMDVTMQSLPPEPGVNPSPYDASAALVAPNKDKA